MRVLFGAAVQGFAAGPDGGRDARFIGTAERFPSAAKPWTGTTIGQAKHTNGFNAHYSDPSFSGTVKSSVLSEEIPRIKKLVESGELQNYILFSNRRLGATAATDIVARLEEEVGLAKEHLYLVGLEYLDDLIREHKKIVELAQIHIFDGPLLVSSEELAEIVLAVSRELGSDFPSVESTPTERISFAHKNRANETSESFAKAGLKRYLPYSAQIQRFLASPDNAEIRALYEGAVEEFQLKIIAQRQDGQPFDRVFNYLTDLLYKRDSVLKRHKALTRAVIFYMYWHCDIGEVPDAEAE